jgi:hypothetical protein
MVTAQYVRTAQPQPPREGWKVVVKKPYKHRGSTYYPPLVIEPTGFSLSRAGATKEDLAHGQLMAGAPELLTQLQEAVRYIVRITALKGPMTKERLEEEEKRIIETVGSVQAGRTLGEMVSFDFAKAKELIDRVTAPINEADLQP